MSVPLPKTLITVVEHVHNCDLCNLLESEHTNIERLENLIAEMKRWPFERDKANVSYVASRKINQLMIKFLQTPEETSLMVAMEAILRNVKQLHLELDLWLAQNIYFAVGKKFYHEKRQQIQENENARKWVAYFDSLGEILRVRIV